MIVSSGSRKRCESSSVINAVLRAAFAAKPEYSKEELVELLYQQVRPELLATINILRRENSARLRGKSVADYEEIQTSDLIRVGARSAVNAWLCNRITSGQIVKVDYPNGGKGVRMVRQNAKRYTVNDSFRDTVLATLKAQMGQPIYGHVLEKSLKSAGYKGRLHELIRTLKAKGHKFTTGYTDLPEHRRAWYVTLNP